MVRPATDFAAMDFTATLLDLDLDRTNSTSIAVEVARTAAARRAEQQATTKN